MATKTNTSCTTSLTSGGQQLNVEMDSLAKVYWNDIESLVLPFYPPSSYEWSLWAGACKLASWVRQSLYNHAQSTPILEHWSKRRNIPHYLIRSIDWEARYQTTRLDLLPLDSQVVGWFCACWQGAAMQYASGPCRMPTLLRLQKCCTRTPLPFPSSSTPVGLVLVQSRPVARGSPHAT
jgi:hypothetical protein